LSIIPLVTKKGYRILDIDIPIEIVERIKGVNMYYMDIQMISIDENVNLIKQNSPNGVLSIPHIQRNNERYNWLKMYKLIN
jgi:hypothetical protein